MKQPAKNEFGPRIKLVRKAMKLTQTQVGELCGVSKGAVSQWESGDTEPNLSSLKKLCLKAKRSADFVVFGAEPSAKALAPEVLSLAEKLLTMNQQKRDLLLSIFETAAPDDRVEQFADPGNRVPGKR